MTHSNMKISCRNVQQKLDKDNDCNLTRYSFKGGKNSLMSPNVIGKICRTLFEDLTVNPERKAVAVFNSDCIITPLRNGLTMIQAKDLSYPNVDEPFLIGQISCAIVLNGIYVTGTTQCDNLLMILKTSAEMTDDVRDKVLPAIMAGFKNCAQHAGVPLTGGDTLENSHLMIGGVATSVRMGCEFIVPDNAMEGDIIVLTKPLGTEYAIMAMRLLKDPEKWARIKKSGITGEEIRTAYEKAVALMTRLNKCAANLMFKYNAHCATYVGRSGLLGCARILAGRQKNALRFILCNVPVLNNVTRIAKAVGSLQPLLEGNAPETSGGLLICMPRAQGVAFGEEFLTKEGYRPWIVGMVESGSRTAAMRSKPRVIELSETVEDH